MTTDTAAELNRLIHAEQHDPFQVLGLHYHDQQQRQALIRTFQPHAESVHLLYDGIETEMVRTWREGIFETFVSDCPPAPLRYRFRITFSDRTSLLRHDPYSFLPQLSDLDRHLFNRGTHYELYNKMGAQPTRIDNISGTIFRLWAPAARRVSVIGNFNHWDGRCHQMRVLGDCGIWELFIPELGENEPYKFEIRTQAGDILHKADPCQFFGELRPKSASLVRDISHFQWQDDHWRRKRAVSPPYKRPLAIYELHLGSWQRDPSDPDRFLTYGELTTSLVPYVKKMGFTHIELMPVMEHPLDESWGYQVTGYYSVNSRHGTPEEFMAFVDCCHQHDIGVILDWVPAHFPVDAHSLSRFDGTALYEHVDPRQGAHPEWGTLIFNYGRKEVSNFLIANALFWLDRYHIDGLRVDAVASMLYLDYGRQPGEWLPNLYGGKENIEAIEFIKHLNSIIYQRFPDVMVIAEESTSFPGVSAPADQGGLGFGFKWNMGWMNDTLDYFRRDAVHRKHHHSALTFSLLYAFSENFILPLSHDEVVHGKRSLLAKMPGDRWQQFANLRLLLLFQWTHPGKKLLFMGNEFGQWSEWYCKRSLDWHLLEEDGPHRQLQSFVIALNRLYQENPSLWENDFIPAGFKWLDFNDIDNSIIAFARFADERSDHLVCLLNFTPQVMHNYRLGVETDLTYHEIFNSDDAAFGGSNTKNNGLYTPVAEPHGEAPCHIHVTVPPLGGIIMQPSKVTDKPRHPFLSLRD